MEPLFRLSGGARHDPAVAAWFAGGDALHALVEPWFERLRACGPDVAELIHDGDPTAVVGDAAFAYVAAYSRHAAIGFFHGADLADPARLLEGGGRRMRHVKLRWDGPPDEDALGALVTAAYDDVRRRLGERA